MITLEQTMGTVYHFLQSYSSALLVAFSWVWMPTLFLVWDFCPVSDLEESSCSPVFFICSPYGCITPVFHTVPLVLQVRISLVQSLERINLRSATRIRRRDIESWAFPFNQFSLHLHATLFLFPLLLGLWSVLSFWVFPGFRCCILSCFDSLLRASMLHNLSSMQIKVYFSSPPWSCAVHNLCV